MGARIAAALAVYHPDAAGSLILADPPLTGPGRDPVPGSPRPLRRFAAQGPGGGDRGRHAARVPDLVGRAPRAARAVARHLQRDGGRRDVREVPHRGPARAAAEDPASRCCSSTAPRVPSCPPSALPELRGLLPGARFAAVERAGHMIPWDNLDDFVAVVLQFTGARARRPLTPSPLPAPTRWAARSPACPHPATPQPPRP